MLQKFLQKLTDQKQGNSPAETLEIFHHISSNILDFGSRINIKTSVGQLRIEQMSLKDFVSANYETPPTIIELFEVGRLSALRSSDRGL